MELSAGCYGNQSNTQWERWGNGGHQETLLCDLLMWDEMLDQSQDTWAQFLAPLFIFLPPSSFTEM